MNASARLLLSAMMFLQFFIWGSWYVTAPNYLGTIGYTAGDFGWLYSAGPIAGILSPLFVGMIADRFFAAQRVLATLHFAGALVLLLATRMMLAGQSPDAINAVFFLYMLTYFPTVALTSTIGMRAMSDPSRQFPGVRVLGTIGWIAANLVVSFLGWSTRIDMFYLAAGGAAAMGLFSLALPHTPPVSTGPISARQIFGLDALVLLRDRSFLVFLLASILISVPAAFYYQLASRVVEMADFGALGVVRGLQQALGTGDVIAATMSIGQVSEIVFLLLMPFCFARLGVKWMLAVGMAAWALRFALFALGASSAERWMILGAIALHGLSYDFFFFTGQIYADQHAPKHLRGQVQGLIVLCTFGIGMAIGAQIAGRVEARHTPPAAREFAAQQQAVAREIAALGAVAPGNTTPANAAAIAELEAKKRDLRQAELRAIEWRGLFAKPAAGAAVVLVLFLLLFRERPRPHSPPADAAGAREPAPTR